MINENTMLFLRVGMTGTASGNNESKAMNRRDTTGPVCIPLPEHRLK